MLRFFKRKKNIFRDILSGGNADYADFVRSFFLELDRPTKAHILVAYQNVIPLVGAMTTVAKQQGSSFSIDDFIIQCSEAREGANDEVNTRRFAWFLWAALVYRLAAMSSRDAPHRETLAEVWCDVARCAPFLKALLPNNVVWKAEEKIWFENVIKETDQEMIAWTINHGGPRSIWQSSAVKKLAEEYELHYFDGADTLGPLTYFPPRPPPAK